MSDKKPRQLTRREIEERITGTTTSRAWATMTSRMSKPKNDWPKCQDLKFETNGIDWWHVLPSGEKVKAERPEAINAALGWPLTSDQHVANTSGGETE